MLVNLHMLDQHSKIHIANEFLRNVLKKQKLFVDSLFFGVVNVTNMLEIFFTYGK